jgi:hypothetical protein
VSKKQFLIHLNIRGRDVVERKNLLPPERPCQQEFGLTLFRIVLSTNGGNTIVRYSGKVGRESLSSDGHNRDVGSGAMGMSAGSLGREQTGSEDKTVFP